MTTAIVRVSVLAGVLGGGAAVLQALLGRLGTRRTRGVPFHPNG
ncbi:hypothetical protein [Rhodococcus sp. T7]|nr:hypothetical protein [Rhodococcus sp. T7]KAF0957398.1 hypothetical protein MLGJGCBP_09230 [Rhodococcus sp. T7]KAF0962131.1 hypothetical protein MLGJGCBP_04752 [Rhodococcus sp. T7]